MINRTLCATFAAAVLVLAPAASAAGKTETLRFYSKTDKLTLVKADGTAVQPGPGVEPAPGDRLEIFASDYVGTHRKHAKRATGSEHVVCTFSTAPEPDCIAHVAIGGSMLIFKGNPGTVTAGTGIYRNATGRVVSAKEVGNDATDVVARIRLHR